VVVEEEGELYSDIIKCVSVKMTWETVMIVANNILVIVETQVGI
jgi:hypothetical protein